MQVCIVMLQVVNLTNKHTEVFCSLSVPMYLTLFKCREASELFIECMPHCHVELVDASQIDEHALLTHPWELIEGGVVFEDSCLVSEVSGLLVMLDDQQCDGTCVHIQVTAQDSVMLLQTAQWKSFNIEGENRRSPRHVPGSNSHSQTI